MELKQKAELFINNNIKESHTVKLEKERAIKGLLSETNSRCQSQLITNKNIAMFLGAFSYINTGGYLRDNVFIGRYCSIGRRVTIAAGMHDMYGLSTHPAMKGINTKYDFEQKEKLNIPNNKKVAYTLIESDVWIGDGVVIMPGVTIGQGAVVGANSVVTKSVPPYSVIGGVPAKIIKKRFPDSIIEQLIETKWYEYSMTDINSLPCRNIFEFLDGFYTAELFKFDYVSELPFYA